MQQRQRGDRDSVRFSRRPIRTDIPAKSMAVLQFENLSDTKDNVFFSDGLSEEILNSLVRIGGLSSFQFKGKDVGTEDQSFHHLRLARESWRMRAPRFAPA